MHEGSAGAAFALHWSRVPNPPADALPGVQVHALWPAPVNPDACFEAAGFTDFADADAHWDDRADALAERVLSSLTQHFGLAQLHHPPLQRALPWPRRWFQRPEPLPLAQQLQEPMHDDRLPMADIRFGSRGARVRTSDGHVLMWIDWPSPAPLPFAGWAQGLSDGCPVHQTELHWPALWPAFRMR